MMSAKNQKPTIIKGVIALIVFVIVVYVAASVLNQETPVPKPVDQAALRKAVVTRSAEVGKHCLPETTNIFRARLLIEATNQTELEQWTRHLDEELKRQLAVC